MPYRKYRLKQKINLLFSVHSKQTSKSPLSIILNLQGTKFFLISLVSMIFLCNIIFYFLMIHLFNDNIIRSQSVPRLHAAELMLQHIPEPLPGPADPYHSPGYPGTRNEAHTCQLTPDDKSATSNGKRNFRVPRRLMVFNFFAKVKLAQRGLMVGTISLYKKK